MAVLTADNAISLLDTAGVLTRPEGKCPAPAPVGDQHVIKVFKCCAGKYYDENYKKPHIVLPLKAE